MRDLSKFRKIKEDRHSATLKHPNGHMVRIAKEALSPELRQQLEKLPVHMAEGTQPDDLHFNQGSSQSQGQPVINIINSPQGSPQVSPQGAGQSSQLPAPTPMMQSPQMPAPGMGHQIGSVVRGGLQDASQAFGDVTAPVRQGFTGFAQGLAGMPEGQGGQGAENAQRAPEISRMPLAGQPSSSLPKVDTNELGQLLSGQRQGLQQEADVMSQQGQQQAQAAHEQAQQLEKAQQKHQMNLDQYTKEYEAIKKDVLNNHIKPNHYIDNMSSGQKIISAIGLVLGGIGGGMTHQENPAMKFLNQQIDRDIHSQMANLDKKSTLLSYNLKMMGNLNDAVKMTTAMQMGIYAAKFAEAGAKAQGPIAQARAVQAKNYYEYQAKIMLNELAIKQALLADNDGQIDPGIKVRYLMDKEQQSKGYEEADEAKNHESLKRILLDAFDRAAKENTVVGRAGRLGRQTPAISELKAAALPFLKDTTGRVNIEEQKAMDDLYPGVGRFSSTDAENRKALERIIDSKISHSRLKGYGIKVPSLPSRTPYETRKK